MTRGRDLPTGRRQLRAVGDIASLAGIRDRPRAISNQAILFVRGTTLVGAASGLAWTMPSSLMKSSERGIDGKAIK